MQDWGGPIGCGHAVRHPERIHSLVLMNTVCGYGTAGRRDLPNPTESAWFRWILEGLPTGWMPKRCCRISAPPFYR